MCPEFCQGSDCYSDCSLVWTAAIVNQDSTINDSSNPATPGSIVSLYAAGEGATSPPGVDGKVAVEPSAALARVTVTIGGLDANCNTRAALRDS